MKSLGKTLKIFVMGTDPGALQTVEIVNWTGLGFIGNRDHIGAVQERAELAEPGVYLLLSIGSGAGLTDIYIGETDNFANRITDHARQKDWWDKFVVFVSKDTNLTKAHVKYLERELLLLAKKSITTLRIRNSGESGGAKLPESDIDAMQEFSLNIRFVLETLGLSYFPVLTGAAGTSQIVIPNQDRSSVEGMDFCLNLPKEFSQQNGSPYQALLNVRGGVFILVAGSHIKREASEQFKGHNYFLLWQQIVNSDMVGPSEHKDLLRITKDIEFRSPSAAGAIVRGYQTNGRLAWKRISDDKTLFDCQVLPLQEKAA
jgi:hypothetical protein